MVEVWEPAPCPQGWVRPAAAVLDLRVLRINGIDFSEGEGLDIYRSYPIAHAFGTCIRVEDGTIAQVSVEFGPEVQGFPQSWLQVGIDSGEGTYRMGEKDDPESRPYSLIYTHAQENPGSSMPTLRSWSASNDDAMQWHDLNARWVSSIPGHHLQLSNKSIGPGDKLVAAIDHTIHVDQITVHARTPLVSLVGKQRRCDSVDVPKAARCVARLVSSRSMVMPAY